MATTLETPPTTSAVSAQKAAIAGGGSNVQTNFEHLTIPQVLQQLGVDPKAGLSSSEAFRRPEKAGRARLGRRLLNAKLSATESPTLFATVQNTHDIGH